MVQRAKHKGSGVRVALKHVTAFGSLDAAARGECIKEIELLRLLDHPNICKHYASFVDEGSAALVLVLELADAGDLRQMIEHFRRSGHRIPEKTIWRLFAQMVAAVAHMHARRALHRDIKPANVFITRGGDVKLGDLGLGRFFVETGQRALTAVGTPFYMAPERLREERYGYKSDVWSLGCVLYEMAMQQSPFYGDDISLFQLIVGAGAPPHPRPSHARRRRPRLWPASRRPSTPPSPPSSQRWCRRASWPVRRRAPTRMRCCGWWSGCGTRARSGPLSYLRLAPVAFMNAMKPSVPSP